MRVYLIKKQTIQDFIDDHASGKSAFESWLTAIQYADWDKPQDIQQTFGSADLLGNGTDRVVFNIGGNNYRMICKYHFGFTKVHLFVYWLGTHSEYDELCDHGEQYIVNAY